MAYFPDNIMPKRLRRESSKEVDDSPLIYNARDYNIHHREIRAIQRLLVGGSVQERIVRDTLQNTPDSQDFPDQDTTGGQGPNQGGNSITDIINRFLVIIDLISNRGYVGQYSGTIQTGGQVPVPSALTTTQTTGTVASTATSIPVVSTSGFTSSGVITKFNYINATELCTDGNPPGGGSKCSVGERKVIGYDGIGSHATNQEIISYSSLTSTSFGGCTRSVNGSTSQATTSTTPALIIPGRASVSFTHNFWGRGTSGTPNQFYLVHDAMLRVQAQLLGTGNRTRTGVVLHDHIEIAWLLTVSGYFDSIDVSQIFSIQE